MSPEKILDKLAKMRAAAEGEAAIGNTAAAEAFAQAINRMLIQHELTMEDIPMAGGKEEPIIELRADLRAHGIKDVSGRVSWQESLARIVSEAHLCKFLVTTGSNMITFVGTKEHATVASYAFGVLCSAADRMSIKARADWWKAEHGGKHVASGNFRAAWLRGFVLRIAERFAEARRAEVKASQMSESTALVRLNQALVRAQAHIAERYKRKAPGISMKGGNSAGYAAGRAAADQMRLGQKGINAGGAGRMLKD